MTAPLAAFIPAANPHWRLAVAPSLRAAAPALAGLRAPAALLQGPQPVAASRFSRVSRGVLALPGAAPDAVYLKEFLDRGALEAIKNLVRPHRALRALAAEQRLAAAGFRVPAALLVGWRQALGIRRQVFVVTRDLGDFRNLYQCAAALDGASPRQRRRWLRGVADAVAALHRAGFSHGDLRPGNLLARERDGRIECAWLDNERTRQFAHLPGRLRLKNLVQLNMLISPALGRRDRLFFFQCYCRHFDDLDAASLRRRVEAKTRARLGRLVERGRLRREDLWL
ncbi:MAG: lipopolysaccharide kinase InaA family protein [Porticoccaceae bacterium]